MRKKIRNFVCPESKEKCTDYRCTPVNRLPMHPGDMSRAL
jgi:hypothetical protein